jgi:dipeptidyl aminopeptidase/acylaminoacyl peptidase
MMGDLQADAAMLRAYSPLRRVAELKKPLLMVYGGRDERVPLVHGERMRDALRPHNPAVEWWVYPTGGHYWGDEATQVDFWSRVEKFLAKHLAAKTP